MTLFQQSLADLEAIKSKRDPNNYNIVFFGDSWVNSGVVSNNIFVMVGWHRATEPVSP